LEVGCQKTEDAAGVSKKPQFEKKALVPDGVEGSAEVEGDHRNRPTIVKVTDDDVYYPM